MLINGVELVIGPKANLNGANLIRANLIRASLDGANLGGSRGKCIEWVAQVRRSDGYDFMLFRMERGELIRAGCRAKKIAEYRVHVGKEYFSTDKAAETYAILDYLELRFNQTKETDQ